MVRRGDIWWLEQPDEKTRPVLVLTRDRAIAVRSKVTVAPLTTRGRVPAAEVRLTPEADGVAQECVVTLDNLSTVSRALLTRPLTSLSDLRMREVCAALSEALDCGSPVG